MKYFSALLAIFILTSCTRLEMIDRKVGEIFFSEPATGSPAFLSIPEREKEPVNPEELGRQAKERIDSWLEEQGLNRYGDPENTYYERGTPLINEAGEAIERYKYILDKHPEILDKIK